MASLQRIEELQELLGYNAPDWVKADNNDSRPVPFKTAIEEAMEVRMDASGELRMLAEESYGGDDDTAMHSVLMDAAERLDDAHQEWLERKLKDKTNKYIVIGRLEHGENTKVIYEVGSAKEAEKKFTHDMQTYADFVPTEVYIDFIFRIPDVDVFVCQDDWGWHEEEQS